MHFAARAVCGAAGLSVLLAAGPATRTAISTTTRPTSAATPPSQASRTPTTNERRAQMHEWFAALAHRDPQEREQARQSLLSLVRDDLPALQKLVEDSRPLTPSQAAALHDIVA